MNGQAGGSSNKAIGLEMGVEYEYEIRFAPDTDGNGNPTGPASKAFPQPAETFTTKISKPDAIEFLNKYVDYSTNTNPPETKSKYIGDASTFEYATSSNATTGTTLDGNTSVPPEGAPDGFYVRY